MATRQSSATTPTIIAVVATVAFLAAATVAFALWTQLSFAQKGAEATVRGLVRRVNSDQESREKLEKELATERQAHAALKEQIRQQLEH